MLYQYFFSLKSITIFLLGNLIIYYHLVVIYLNNKVAEPINNPKKDQPKQINSEAERKDQERRIQDVLKMASTEDVQQAIEQMKPAFHTGMPTPKPKKVWEGNKIVD